MTNEAASKDAVRDRMAYLCRFLAECNHAYYVEDAPSHGVAEIFPITFNMRKWVRDDSDKPAFLALGIGGVPSEPEYLYFSRFFNFNDRLFDMDRNKGLLLNWLRPPFLRKVIEDEFERIFSPL